MAAKESTEPPHAGEVAEVDGDAEAGPSGGAGDEELRQLPDQLLKGRLQRMQRGVDGGIADRLPDGGATYRVRLLALRGELARRQAAAALSATPPSSSSSEQPPPPDPDGRRVEPADDARCEPVVHSSCAQPSDIRVNSSLPAQLETPACPSKQKPDANLVKPKLEPCEDSPMPSPDAADDWETTPLSGDHPFFTHILSRSQVQKPFQLCIPGRFHKRLPESCTAATLICRGKSWAMSYRGDLKVKRLDADWMDFAIDNRLQVDDACVFELLTCTKEEVVFHMQILRGGLPKEITSKGATAEEPMVIVD